MRKKGAGRFSQPLPCIILSSLLFIHVLFFPPYWGLAAEQNPASQVQIEDEDQEIEDQEESTDSSPSDSGILGDIEISIKPKVQDTIRSDCIHPPVKFKYDIAPNWELFLKLNTFINNPLRGEDRNGMSDVSIGTKYHWKKFFKPYVDTASAFSVQIPTSSDEEVSDGYTHYRPELMLSKRIPECYQIRLFTHIYLDILSGNNETFELLERESLNNSLTWNLGVQCPTRLFIYSIETEWITTEVSGGTQNSVYFISGIFWEINEKKHRLIRGSMNLGLGLRIGLNDTEEDFAFFVKINWDLPFKMKWRGGSEKDLK